MAAILPDPMFPCPPLTVELQGKESLADSHLLSRLPAHAGVYCLQDESGQTLYLTATSNIRRSALAKLQPATGESRSHIDFRSVAHRLCGLTVGSMFEADWAYLQWARRLLPQTYREVLDRWQAWFIHCDPLDAYPQFTKTAHPRVYVAGVHIGPFRDKHAAGKYMELLQDVFDLCRYHHILVQAPRATACAYKEMGRCPAPCDGSVSMNSYRDQINRAIEFACTPFSVWHAQIETTMQQASASLDFERAMRCRELLGRAKPASRAEFDMLDRLERFAFIAIMPSEKANWARLFLIKGGWIAPLVDFDFTAPLSETGELFHRSIEHAADLEFDASPFAMENIGMVCWHLFRPAQSRRGCFIRLSEARDEETITNALRTLRKPAEQEHSAINEHDLTHLEREPG